MIEAVKFGHEAVVKICDALDAWALRVGKPKRTGTLRQVPEDLMALMEESVSAEIEAVLAPTEGKLATAINTELNALESATLERLAGADAGDSAYGETDVKLAFKKIAARKMRALVRETGRRCDGRVPTEVRPIDIELALLPGAHGSALFTRGETQSVATCTLGDSGMKQTIDDLDGSTQKRFYLQYTFPPSSVGEVGRVGGPGRREVGHGNLAERSLIPLLPKEDNFPYSMRVESLITESCGSSSMASVCGGSLAMMDAGVPIERVVAGVAMGLLLDEDGGQDEPIILTDILGLEDALGTMDLKARANRFPGVFDPSAAPRD